MFPEVNFCGISSLHKIKHAYSAFIKRKAYTLSYLFARWKSYFLMSIKDYEHSDGREKKNVYFIFSGKSLPPPIKCSGEKLQWIQTLNPNFSLKSYIRFKLWKRANQKENAGLLASLNSRAYTTSKRTLSSLSDIRNV